MHDAAWVLNRIEDLIQLNSDTFPDRWRIRSIMNGGPDGIQAVMAWDFGKGASSLSGSQVADKIGVDLPTVNLLHSGLERTGQQLGRLPTLKPPASDDDTVRGGHQKRIDILQGWDAMQRFELQFPQIGRWLPGYAFYMQIIKQRRNADGELYPVVELRDPYDVHPGWFGAEQQPQDAAVPRVVPLYALENVYGDQDWGAIATRIKDLRTKALLGQAESGRSTGPGQRGRTWEGKQTGIEVVEYYGTDGTYIVIPEVEVALDYMESPLPSGQTFVFAKRISFDKLISQYHHVIGLMALLARFNILSYMSAKDNVFRPTNIFGEQIEDEYEFGRFAVNTFEPGASVTRPSMEIQNQTWGQIDRLERQLRIGAQYDVQQDAISPNSFATGAGMRELQNAVSANLAEYQMVIRNATELVDGKRLEWADQLYGSQERTYFDMYGKKQSYRPGTAIAGDYRTRRVYGAMATFDDAQKIVVGLQLLQGRIIDIETLQENIDGLEDLPLINERITRKEAKDTLYALLTQRAGGPEGDPRAEAAMVRIMEKPADETAILMEYFAPEGGEQEGPPMALPIPQQGGPIPGAPPESMTSVLSRVESTGQTEGGVQTVGALP